MPDNEATPEERRRKFCALLTENHVSLQDCMKIIGRKRSVVFAYRNGTVEVPAWAIRLLELELADRARRAVA